MAQVIKGIRAVINMLKGAVDDPGNTAKLAQARVEAKAALKKLDEKGAAGTASDDKNAAEIQRLLRQASGASVSRTAGRTPARETARGGVQQVTRDGATDLGTPAGTRSSGSGRGTMVQGKVKPQTLATRFDALTPSARRAEQLKGDESIYADVMKQRAGTLSTKPGKPVKLAPVGFNKGGFPDLSGDGKVTQKDILMGRGAMNKGGMYAAGGYVTNMLGKKKK